MSCKEKDVEIFPNANKRVMHGYANISDYHLGQGELPDNKCHNIQNIISPSGQSTQRILNEKPQERYVWEMRTRSPNLTPASTVLNSPDLNTDVQYVMQQQQRQHMQIHVGRSPGSQFEQTDMLPQGLASPGSPTDVGKADGQCLRDGEIVVFDDIDTNWMNSSNSYHKKPPVSPSTYQNNEDVLKVTKMIGQLPIAEYEGSPRRFGSQTNTSNSSKTVSMNSINGSAPKRPPGFPQRVSPKHSSSSSSNQETFRKQQIQTFCAVIASSKNSENKSSVNLIDIDDDSCEKQQPNVKSPTFDYLYECSETRKVLEEFFKGNMEEEKRFTDFTESNDEIVNCEMHNECDSIYQNDKHINQAIVGQRLARIPNEELYLVHRSPKKQPTEISFSEQNIELYIDSNSRSSGDLADTELEANLRRHSRNFTLSPETTDYDSNCGDLDSLSNDINCQTDYSKLYTSMPVLEDGLSSGHASDTENNGTITFDKSDNKENNLTVLSVEDEYNELPEQNTCENCLESSNNIMSNFEDLANETATLQVASPQKQYFNELMTDSGCCNSSSRNNSNEFSSETNYEPIYATISSSTKKTPQNEQSHINTHQSQIKQNEATDIIEAMKEIRSALQRAKTQPEKLKFCDEVLPADPDSPVWVPRNKVQIKSSCHFNNNVHIGNLCVTENENRINLGHVEDEDQDTDLETDRLLGHQRPEEQDIFDDQTIWPKTSRIGMCEANDPSQFIGELTVHNSSLHPNTHIPQTFSSATIRQGIGTSLTPNSPENCQIDGNCEDALPSPENLQYSKTSPSGSIKSLKDSTNSDKKAKARNKEGFLEPEVLIEGVLFRARYLGSTQLVCEGQPTKSTRMMQAEEAVSRIKAPEGESQPSTEVDLFISTEKIMVLNTDLKEIMMDHALRTISYIADIGDLVVLMARRRFVPSPDHSNSDNDTQTKDNKENSTGSNKHNRTPKMICHVFESDEAQFIAQSIGQAFQVAYMEFLKANGIENENLAKEMDYQEVLNSQEIFGDELEIFAKKELQKEVVVPKAKGEILGVVIVESGWGSMLPTVVIANLMSGGAAARCGQLNIGDQLIAINGLSLVGLPLSTCQNYIRNTKNQTAVKFTVVPCPPVVEVKIIRPKALFQLGFSVQNGVICSLLRGGIAERGGVRVGHRIIEINNQSVVAVPHDTIVKLLSSSVGEILMKTMPTSMFRLLTGQETPIYI